MSLNTNNLTYDEYRHIVEPYIIEKLQQGFSDTHFEIDIKRFANLYGYQELSAQKQLGNLIRSLSKKDIPTLIKLVHEESKPWIISYNHNIKDNIYSINFNKQLSKLVFNSFKETFVQAKPVFSQAV